MAEPKLEIERRLDEVEVAIVRINMAITNLARLSDSPYTVSVIERILRGEEGLVQDASSEG